MTRNELSISHLAANHGSRNKQEDVGSESEPASTSEAITSLSYSTSKQTRQKLLNKIENIEFSAILLQGIDVMLGRAVTSC